MIASGRTTVSVKGETLRRLRGYKLGNATFDDVLNEMMDEALSAAFVQEHLRRLRKGETVSWTSVHARLKLRDPPSIEVALSKSAEREFEQRSREVQARLAAAIEPCRRAPPERDQGWIVVP